MNTGHLESFTGLVQLVVVIIIIINNNTIIIINTTTTIVSDTQHILHL